MSREIMKLRFQTASNDVGFMGADGAHVERGVW